jgi:sialate O-acetylesterase
MLLQTLFWFALACSPSVAAAAAPTSLSVSNVFGSHMVLQRDRPAPVWGWATPGAAVAVSFDGKTHAASAAAQTGFWKVMLPSQPASLVGRDIAVSSSSSSGGSEESVLLSDVLFGEVLLCSGQSNMEFVLPAAANATAEIAAADAYPHIRVFSGPMQNADRLNATGDFNVTHDQLKFVRMGWSVASSASVGGCPAGAHCDTCCGNKVAPPGTGSYFSAVCWFAARDLADLLGGAVPVGGIDQSYGGTSIQFWMGARSIAASDAPVATQCCGQNGGASCLYNTQIHPYTLGPTQFAATLFYQGEQNANCGGPTQVAGAVYSSMLQQMVAEWRAALGYAAMPFGAVLRRFATTKTWPRSRSCASRRPTSRQHQAAEVELPAVAAAAATPTRLW